jgi:hypothetical protein
MPSSHAAAVSEARNGKRLKPLSRCGQRIPASRPSAKAEGSLSAR